MSEKKPDALVSIAPEALARQLLSHVPQQVTIQQAEAFLAKAQELLLVNMQLNWGEKAARIKAAEQANQEKDLDLQDKEALLKTRPQVYQAQAEAEITALKAQVPIPAVLQRIDALAQEVAELTRTVAKLRTDTHKELDDLGRKTKAHADMLHDLNQELEERLFRTTLSPEDDAPPDPTDPRDR